MLALGIRDGLLEGQLEPARSPYWACLPDDFFRMGQMEVRNAPQELFQSDPELHPGEVSPEATVGTRPERKMAVRGAGE